MTRYLAGPGPDDSHDTRVPLILGVTISLFAASFTVWLLRMYTRCRPVRRLSWDDLFISVAMLFSVASSAISIANVIVGGYGLHTAQLSPETVVEFAHLALIAEPLWVWEVTFIKISVAFMFLRFHRAVAWSTAWKALMYFSIFYLFLTAAVVLGYQMTECTPLQFYWDHTVPGGRCRSPEEVRIGIIGTSVVFAFSDFQFSLLPLTFVLTLNRPRGERVAVACLMGLGLLASIIGCLKFIDFNQIITTPDPTYVMVIWKMGSLAEAKIGMIAANVPPLKAWGEGMLVKVRSSIFVSKKSSTEGTSALGENSQIEYWELEERVKPKGYPQLVIEEV